jgi:hypothetical protein
VTGPSYLSIMAMSSVPLTGPLRIDCRGTSGHLAVRRVESLLKKLRGGARELVIRVDGPDVIDVLIGWTRNGSAPHEVVRGKNGALELRVYLLPRDFDAHPLLAFRPALGTPTEADLVMVP